MASPDTWNATIQAVLDEAVDRFKRKATGYGQEITFSYGPEVQAPEITRKAGKVKRIIWDGIEPVEGESIEEVLDDLIGHCLILKARLRLGHEPFSEKREMGWVAEYDDPKDRCPSCGAVNGWVGPPDSAECEDSWHG